MAASLDVHVTTVDGGFVITPVGEVDVSTAHRLARALERSHGAVEVDCGGVRLIDAAGLGVLAHAASTNGSLVIRGTTPFLRRTFQAAGLEHLLAVAER